MNFKLIKKMKKSGFSKSMRFFLWKIFVTAPLVILANLLSAMLMLLLVIILPFAHFRIGAISQAGRLGCLSMNLELFGRKRQDGYAKGKRYIFICEWPCNAQLIKMWRRHYTIIESPFLFRLFRYTKWLWSRTCFFESIGHPWGSGPFHILSKGKPVLSFSDQEEKQGKNFLRKMGIDPKKDWYVCVFARDGEYLNKTYPSRQWEYHDHRNADINQFVPAIQYLLDLGGYVVRVGYHVEKPVDLKHPQFIDYSIDFRDDFMDIYLIAKCRFFLGNTSGPQDLANIFDTPTVGVSWADIGTFPIGKNNVYIPKKVRDRKNNEQVSFSYLIQNYSNNKNVIFGSSFKLHKAGYILEENSKEEILEATREMMIRCNKRWNPSKEDQYLMEQYYKVFPEQHPGYGARTPISLSFLKKYQHLWFDSHLMPQLN